MLLLPLSVAATAAVADDGDADAFSSSLLLAPFPFRGGKPKNQKPRTPWLAHHAIVCFPQPPFTLCILYVPNARTREKIM
jgi:hypothetical protein